MYPPCQVVLARRMHHIHLDLDLLYLFSMTDLHHVFFYVSAASLILNICIIFEICICDRYI